MSKFLAGGKLAGGNPERGRVDNDFYATDPKAVHKLLLKYSINGSEILEPCIGNGNIANAIKDFYNNKGLNITGVDIVDRGYPNTEIIDFLTYNEPITTDVITNPPYKLATDFVRHSLDLAEDGVKVAMFLKIQFLEGKERKKLFTEYPPKTIYVSSSRLLCAKNGEFEKMKAGGGSAVAYAWYVWVKGYKGDTVVKWIN